MGVNTLMDALRWATGFVRAGILENSAELQTFRNCEKSKKQKNYINLQRIHIRTAGLLFYWGQKNYGMMDGIIDDERNR